MFLCYSLLPTKPYRQRLLTFLFLFFGGVKLLVLSKKNVFFPSRFSASDVLERWSAFASKNQSVASSDKKRSQFTSSVVSQKDSAANSPSLAANTAARSQPHVAHPASNNAASSKRRRSHHPKKSHSSSPSASSPSTQSWDV